MPIRLSLLIVILTLFCGCETASGPASEGDYVAPAAGATATIRGSRNRDNSFFEGEHVGRVLLIDSRLLRASEANVEEPVALTAGKHNIVAEYRHSNFLSQAYLTFEATPGSAYQLTIRNGREAPDDQRYCEFWITDLTAGKPVTEVLHRRVSGGKTSSTFSAR
jgi:hypothetical protein